MKDLIDIIALACVRLGVLVMYLLPPRVGFYFARGIVEGVLLCIPRLKGVARRNLELAFPEKSPAERHEIARKSFNVLAQNLLGFARIPHLNRENAPQLIDYSEALALYRQCRSESPDVGIIVPSVHFGMAESIIQFHALIVGRLAVLARGFGLRRLDEWWNARRAYFGNEIFARKGGYREVIAHLQKGVDVAILCDQNVKVNHAVFCDFFGIKAATTKTVAIAALRTGAPIIFAASMQRDDGKFEIFVKRLPNPREEEGTNEERVERFTTRLNSAIEELIRRHPEQWYWIHRRWKTRPAGELETIYDDLDRGAA